MVLRKGSSGYQVELMQTKLKLCGYDVDVDGAFGPGTQKVLKAFQTDNGLKVDGIYGPNSQRILSTKPKMKFQSYWLDGQTQVIKLRRQITKVDIIDVKRMSVKSLWGTLKNKPKLLINGGLFDMKTGKDLNEFIDEYAALGSGYYSNVGLKTNWYRDLSIGKRDRDRDFLGGSPALLIDGKRETDYPHLDHGFVHGNHPRIGVGVNDSYIYIVVVNGRNKWKRWYGTTIEGLTNIFIELACSDAINLDGGGSITVLDKLGLYLKYGYRKVANMVAFYQD